MTARVAPESPVMSGRTVGAIDAVQYYALPVNAQNEMGYINLHFAGLPNEIIITKRWTHNVEDIQSLLIEVHDEPFTLRIHG